MINKKVLLVGIGFYDYEDFILNSLRKRFSSVSYITARSLFFRHYIFFLLRKIRFLLIFDKIIREYRILEMAKKSDLIIIIKGDSISEELLIKIKHTNENSKIILYLWDGLEKVNNVFTNLKYYNSAYTFDLKDSLEHSQLKYLPLPSRLNSSKDFFFTFIGTLHSNRKAILEDLILIASSNDLSVFIYIHVSLKQYINLFRSPLFKYANLHFIRTDKYKDILNNTEFYLDIADNNQSGLSLGLIESIATGCKVISSNNHIDLYGLEDKVIKYSSVSLAALANDANKKSTIDSWIEVVTDECC